MSWNDLLNNGSEQVLPWFGYRKVHDAVRSWTIFGRQPLEHGWYRFHVTGGRKAKLAHEEPCDLNLEWGEEQPKIRGYLVGDRLIPASARVEPNPEKLIEQTHIVYCIEPGLEKFSRVLVVENREQQLVYHSQELPAGPEGEVIEAYQDRMECINDIRGVTPALDLAFRWLSYQRLKKEEHQKELQRLHEEEEIKQAEEARLQQLMSDAGTAVGRRALAERDFESAAREALRISGAELLDARESYNRGEMVVQYRFMNRRLECLVNSRTLRVISSGVCLTDEHTGVSGDTWLTLESLPGVIGEAIKLGRLVIYRHVDDY